MSDHTIGANPAHSNGHAHQDTASVRVFGFWIYIMSDVILFASLFATFSVLSTHYAGGPTGHDIFRLPGVLAETAFLLISSFTYGMAILARNRDSKNEVVGWLALTFVLGASFVGLEINEFYHLIIEGNGPNRSAFLSAFFTLVSTHGLHVTTGLIWMITLIVQISKKGLNATNRTRMMTLSLFWHFLDIVWICVFTFVYLMGAM